MPIEKMIPDVSDCTLCGEAKESSKILHMHSTHPAFPCTNVCVGCVNRLVQYTIQNKMTDVDEV